MTAIVCVGEQERLGFDAAVEVSAAQLRLLAGCDSRRLVLAYEPSWAIGVGAHPAAPGWVSRVHRAIRQAVKAWVPDAPVVPIIYGGSVSLDAAPTLLAQAAVDGLFVGRQALDPRVFAAIAHVEPAATRPSTVP